MLARALAATPWGIEARTVEVEADVHNGVPAYQLVGLPDTAVRESRDRVRAAIINCGYQLPGKSVVINLAPADLRKEGNHLDLAIALALLGAYEKIPAAALERRVLCGELGLDGALRPVRGALGIAALAAASGAREILLPAANAPLAAALGTLPVIPVTSLVEAIAHLNGTCRIPAQAPGENPIDDIYEDGPDLAEVKGQETAKRALEIAAAGGHNLLFVGPPGAGKTLLARCLPGILPALSIDESITVTKIHSLITDQPRRTLLQARPFRSPHSSASTAALIGGGSIPRPGEVTLAHAGVLFLDELPEFRRDSLEALRQPLEDGLVAVVRARARVTFPARFALVAAMNPCPCGHLGDERHDCRCSPQHRHRYRDRISGPLLDRIDLRVEVPALSIDQLRGPAGEPSSAVRQRIRQARSLQLERLAGTARLPVNAALDGPRVERHCSPDARGRQLLDRAFRSLGLSARALHRILKVARTLADLDGGGAVASAHVAEALQYRGTTPLD